MGHLDISKPAVVNDFDPIDFLIQDFDGEIVQDALFNFRYGADNSHLYLNETMPDGHILDTLNENVKELSEIIPYDNNTLNAAKIKGPHPDSVSASSYVTTQHLGHMVDDGGSHSLIGAAELQILRLCKTRLD